jgi:KEOPS complex subunit Cgi121
VLIRFQEFKKCCDITGFRNVELNSTEAFLEKIEMRKPLSAVVQFFDADVIATWQHLYFAVLNALTVFKNKENISKNLSMEIMLYASARRQIRKATQLVGIKPGSRNLAVVVVERDAKSVKSVSNAISTHVGRPSDDSVLGLSREKMKRIRATFDISDVELKAIVEGDSVERAIVDLVIERVSLLATQH